MKYNTILFLGHKLTKKKQLSPEPWKFMHTLASVKLAQTDLKYKWAMFQHYL